MIIGIAEKSLEKGQALASHDIRDDRHLAGFIQMRKMGEVACCATAHHVLIGIYNGSDIAENVGAEAHQEGLQGGV